MISAKCGGCGKVYKVEERLAGKRVKCKACGGTFSIPKVMAGVPLGAGKAVAAKAAVGKVGVAKAPVAKPARAVAAPVSTASAVEDDPFNNLDALMSLEQTGTVDDSPPPVPMTPPTYASAAGKRRGPIVEYVNEEGTTSSRPHRSQPLSYAAASGESSAATAFLVDRVVPWILVSIGWGLPMLFQLLALAVVPSKGPYLLLIIFSQVLLFGVYLPTVLKGLTYAATNCRFEMPDNPRVKTLAIGYGMGLVGSLGFLILVGNFKAFNSIGPVLGALGMVLLMSLAAGYCLFKLLFHCTWVQAIVGFLMYLLFVILGVIACLGAIYAVGMIFGGLNTLTQAGR